MRGIEQVQFAPADARRLTERALAAGSLPSSTSITSKDITGQDRSIFVESNWKVCTQNPKPGARFNGQPVTLGVVKFGEPCP